MQVEPGRSPRAFSVIILFSLVLLSQDGVLATDAHLIEHTMENGKHFLRVKLADDDRKHLILESPRVIERPIISGNAKYVAYVSYEGELPGLFVQQLTTGLRARVVDVVGEVITLEFQEQGSVLVLETDQGEARIQLGD